MRPAEKNPEETRHKRRPRSDERAERRSEQRRQPHGTTPTTHEPDKLQNHDQWAGSCFRQAQSIHHLARREPVIMFDRLLRDVGQHGIRAAEGDDGRFAKEESFLKQRVVPAVPEPKPQNRRPPQKTPDKTDADSSAERRLRVLRRFRVVIKNAQLSLALDRRMTVAAGEHCRRHFAADKTDKPRAQHDDRKWRLQEKDSCEGSRGDDPHDGIAQCFSANAKDGIRDDGKHRGLEPIKYRRDPRHIAIGGVNETQSPQNEHRRDDKERAGHNAAPGFVQKPAAVDGELLRLGSGQEHAKIQRMQKARLADPAPSLD